MFLLVIAAFFSGTVFYGTMVIRKPAGGKAPIGMPGIVSFVVLRLVAVSAGWRFDYADYPWHNRRRR